MATDRSLAQDSNRRAPIPQIRYELGSDSLKQEGVPEGKLEGPFLLQSKIIENTIRKYWVYVPAQYSPDQPANVLVFQDGARAINPNGVIRVPQVLENLIAKKQIPVTIGIFITPGQRGDEFPDSIGTGNPNNRDREYDVLTDAYARMLIEEILPEVGSKYNLSDDPSARVIGGSSSGGICAFTVAWQRPDAFRNVISFIGSFTNNSRWSRLPGSGSRIRQEAHSDLSAGWRERLAQPRQSGTRLAHSKPEDGRRIPGKGLRHGPCVWRGWSLR